MPMRKIAVLNLRPASFSSFFQNRKGARPFSLAPFSVFTLMLTLLLSGCLTLAEKRAMESDIMSLQASVEVLRKRLESREEESSSHESKRLENLADLKVAFEEFRSDFQQTSARIEEIKHTIELDKKNAQKSFQDTDLRLQDLEKSSSEIKLRLDDLQKKQDASAKKVPVETKGSKKNSQAEKSPYDEALSLINPKSGKPSADDLEQAEGLLQQFISENPKHKHLVPAHFWLGEVYFRKNDFARAIIEFESVMEMDPKNQKAPQARFKQGLCFLQRKETKTAIDVFNDVISRFPDSKEAKTSKEKLKEIKKS